MRALANILFWTIAVPIILIVIAILILITPDRRVDLGSSEDAMRPD